MKATQKGTGFIVYEKDREDLMQDAILAMAKMDAQLLSDEDAASFGVLFAQWEAGETYLAGARISDEAGNLYKVVQDHVSQADWPIESTATLYTPLGVTAEEPDAIAEWVQPTGSHDAYQVGDMVTWNGVVYVCELSDNTWSPDVTGWMEMSDTADDNS